MFTLTLTDTAWNWFVSIMNIIPDIYTVKETFMKRFNSWGEILREQCTYWQNMKFDHNKCDI